MIVPSPVPSAIVAFEGLESVMPNVSSNSSRTSPLTVIATDEVVAPAAIVRLPVAAT